MEIYIFDVKKIRQCILFPTSIKVFNDLYYFNKAENFRERN